MSDQDLENVSADRDPIETMDMSQQLEELRGLFQSRGYVKKQSNSDGEVWERPLGGQPGYKWFLLVDPGMRIRAELKNPVGAQLTVITPALPVDVEIAMRQYGVG